MDRVAVYGSLRAGCGNHRLLEGSECIGTYRIDAPFKMHSLGGFPALVPDAEDNSIVVEVYEVDDTTMAKLDGLEGYPSFYNRMVISVSASLNAWIYFMEDREFKDDSFVVSGDWVQFLSTKQYI